MPLHPDISIEQLKAFRAVADELSFSKAAKRLFRTQSAISIQISRLEDNVSQKLFHRSTKHIEITPAGNILLIYVDRIFAAIEEAQTALLDMNKEVKGRLTISTSDTTACYRLPMIFQEYQKKYPLVEMVIRNHTSLQTIEKVANNEVDLGIATLRNLPDNISSKALFERRDILICHPDHKLATRNEIFLKDLENHQVILLDRNCSSRRLLDDYCIEAQVKLNISMELSSIEVVKSLVKINTGVSIVPEASVIENIDQGLLIGISIADIDRQTPIQTGPIYNRNRYLSNAAKAFITLLEQH